MFDDITQHRLHALPNSLKLEVLKIQNRKISANLNYLIAKCSCFNYENAYPHLIFLFTNKKDVDV